MLLICYASSTILCSCYKSIFKPNVYIPCINYKQANELLSFLNPWKIIKLLEDGTTTEVG
jgi:hypothetical protein